MIIVTPDISLNEDELQITAKRASGPGGQHVNTTNSAVQLKFNAATSPAIEPAVMGRLANLAGQRMTRDGVIVIHVSDEKSQHRNRAIATERLVQLIQAAATPPKPRRKTLPSKGSITRRLDGKARAGKLKKTRGRVTGED
jgi:ribosome-associated protein